MSQCTGDEFIEIAHAADPWLFDLADESTVRVRVIYRPVEENFPPRALAEIIEIILGAAP